MTTGGGAQQEEAMVSGEIPERVFTVGVLPHETAAPAGAEPSILSLTTEGVPATPVSSFGRLFLSKAPAIRTEQVRCRFCTRFVSKNEVAGAEASGYMCRRCSEWHFHALAVLGGADPCGCQDCNTSWEQLKERANGGDIRMYVVPKDGIYQLLCAQCRDRYVSQRVDHYGDTSYGARLNLK